jgi:hypothetical protein
LKILAFSSSLHASYAISVRQTSALPAASFRFHLAMDTLAVQLTIPPVGFVGDFHSQVSAPCRAHQNKSGEGPEALAALPISIENRNAASLRSRRIDALQRNIKIERQVRHHVVVRLISTSGRQGLIRHLHEIRRCCVRVALAGLREGVANRNV